MPPTASSRRSASATTETTAKTANSSGATRSSARRLTTSGAWTESWSELRQRHLRVGESRDVHGLAGLDQVADLVDDVPDVDVHAGDDVVPGQPERDELPAGEVAADDDPLVVPGTRVADVLHAQVVLVAEEVRQPVVDGPLAEHRPG